MSRITDLTEKLPFWDKLSKEEREYVNSVSFLRRFEKDSFIHGSGNDCLGMFLVISGEIRTYLLSEEGREITLFRLYPNDICVLSASCVISQITFDTFMTAKQETEVLIVPANAVALLKERNINIKCFLYELAVKRFSDVMWSMQQIMFRSLDKRLAEFLVSESERTGSNTLRITHEQIAQNISSAREAATRMLKSFSADGLVELNRGTIIIKDLSSLKDILQ